MKKKHYRRSFVLVLLLGAIGTLLASFGNGLEPIPSVEAQPTVGSFERLTKMAAALEREPGLTILKEHLGLEEREVEFVHHKTESLVVVVDLRARRKVLDAETLEDEPSRTLRIHRLKLAESPPGASHVRSPHMTSGLAIHPLSLPDGAHWFIDPDDTAFMGELGLLRKQRDRGDEGGSFETLKNMDKHYMIQLPIPESRDDAIEYALIYYNAFQGEEEEWTGVQLDSDTKRLELQVKFPGHKKPQHYTRFKREARLKEGVPTEVGDVTMSSDATLRWVIKDAKKGNIFYIRWEW